MRAAALFHVVEESHPGQHPRRGGIAGALEMRRLESTAGPVVLDRGRLGDPENPKLLEHGVLLHILLQAALQLGVIALDFVLIRELRRQQVDGYVERIFFLRVNNEVAALSHLSPLREALAVAGAMQLDQPIAERRIDEEITHELHPAMLPQKKRAPGGARSSAVAALLRSD